MIQEKTPIFLHPKKRLDLFEQGKVFFNEGHFFEAHEIWEKLWQEEQGRDKEFIQGMILAAAHFVHLQKQNFSGAESVANNAQKKLLIPPQNSIYQSYDIKPILSAIDYNLSLLRLTPPNKEFETFLIPQLLAK